MIIELPIVERKILMSVVIIGGNECMVCKYKSLCKEYQCKAKVFVNYNEAMKKKIGCPDLMVCLLYTSDAADEL